MHTKTNLSLVTKFSKLTTDWTMDIDFGWGLTWDLTREAYSDPQTPSWWKGGSPLPPQNPTIPRPFRLQPSLCRPQHLPKINFSYGFGKTVKYRRVNTEYTGVLCDTLAILRWPTARDLTFCNNYCAQWLQCSSSYIYIFITFRINMLNASDQNCMFISLALRLAASAVTSMSWTQQLHEYIL